MKKTEQTNKAICISAIASNQGKTILTSALLYHYKNSVRPYKIGPDFIDPQFHTKIANTPSINLDSFMMNQSQVRWIYDNYNDKNISILEGVMGFYDGFDKGCSAYDVTKLLDIPTVLILDGSGSYITISAVLKGLKEYKKDNTIKGVVLNKLSSSMHYELIKKHILVDFDDVVVLGWIGKNLDSLKDTHLGLDLNSIEKLESISKEVLKNIDISALENLAISSTSKETKNIYPFDKLEKSNKKIAIVSDKNFSFLYHDNIQFLKEIFSEVVVVNSVDDDIIEDDVDMVYIVGGYVETTQHYNNIKDSINFRNSLIKHSETKPIYAECAGLLYLGNRVDEKKMSAILDVDFTLQEKRSRLGYYYNCKNIKGHSFHYTKPTDLKDGFCTLSKKRYGKGEVASWQKSKVYGTYLHIFLRNNTSVIKEYFEI
ncbi:MAG: cobyrinate a,c-diamide synthase [Arcobacteraceae bacterium]|nr:cobyrinate a,c-diamide synthase [Arcobacteraceae bacterium]